MLSRSENLDMGTRLQSYPFLPEGLSSSVNCFGAEAVAFMKSISREPGNYIFNSAGMDSVLMIFSIVPASLAMVSNRAAFSSSRLL